MARSKKQWRKRRTRVTRSAYREMSVRKSASSTSSEPAVLPIAPLTVEEESARDSLERKVERAFYEAGMALMELRDRRLYRSTHATFEEYCRDCAPRSGLSPIALIILAVVPIS